MTRRWVLIWSYGPFFERREFRSLRRAFCVRRRRARQGFATQIIRKAAGA